MSGPGAGFEYPPYEVSWLKRDALLFANTIGCTADELHFLYELDPNFAVFPTYPIILPFKKDSQDVIDFYAAQKAIKIPSVPEFDARRVVDGQRLVQFLKPLPTTSAGRKFEMRSKVLGVYDKGRPGTVVETQQDLVDAATGEVYSRAIGSAFYVAQGNWGGPKGPATENFPPPKGKKPDVVFEEQTKRETPLLYRLNGDYNPLHAHPEPGKKMGFGGVITHGLHCFNVSCHGLLMKLGASDPGNIKEFQARFASPVKPGDKLVTSVWRTGEFKGEWEEIRFVTEVAGGKVCLSNGRALMKVVGKASKQRVMTSTPKPGDRLSYDGVVCTVRYVGEVKGTSGSWLGVEWDDPARGKHDGSHKGVRYFTCQSKSPTAASFVRPTRPVEKPQSFVTALNDKYTAELSTASAIKFSGKVAEEVGFDKIRRKQARLSDLKVAILDGTRIDRAYSDEDAPITEVCPKIVELDLSRNLFQRAGTVVSICSHLASLRSLRLNGNRFQDIQHDEGLQGAEKSLGNVKDLALEETLMSWEEICHIATKFPALAGLSASTNQLPHLPPTPLSTLSTTLVSLNLEFNEFTSISNLANLAGLQTLRNLHLKGNNIAAMTSDYSDTLPVFQASLQYLDVSYNQVDSWSFIDDIPTCFPGLISLRFAHNPIYDNPDPERTAQPNNSTEEAYMFTVGRLANLKTLNFGSISHTDRQDAEMFYLARIGKHLASVGENQEADVIKQHRRYAELCELYGPPVVTRREEINPAFLEARLITTQFVYRPHEAPETVERTTKIPKSFDIYAVKGIAGKLFGVRPLGLRLIWETGEWDPVAGFDDEVDDSDDEEDTEPQDIEGDGNLEPADISLSDNSTTGKWIKREVELQDGPRQLGFCVDGMEAKIRVEIR
ncbi:Thioesterase/thiol ester dehydrase-isomerase [Xylariomycetidae sp. FL2044]|nr:Thioesterase/thiol ester dehydrase-isomerase [Xylariomycetidae sp. FL2044]